MVYVTDELRLYNTEETSGRAKKTLRQRRPADRAGKIAHVYSVRTDDGDQGWVKTAYIVEVEPARSKLARVEAEAAATSTRLLETEAALTEATGQAETLSTQLAEANAGITELPALRRERCVKSQPGSLWSAGTGALADRCSADQRHRWRSDRLLVAGPAGPQPLWWHAPY